MLLLMRVALVFCNTNADCIMIGEKCADLMLASR
jgi:hypothetical protein